MASSLFHIFTLLAVIVAGAYSVGIYQQCAGEGYGTFPCDAGLACFRRNKWYSSCQHSCPKNLGWDCETMAPLQPVATVAIGWDQCGGSGWRGPTTCVAGYACYARSVYYSQCRPVNNCPPDWACAALITGSTLVPRPVVLAPYARCNDGANTVCPSGTACFRSTAVYSECRPSCPPTWTCETDVLGPNEQCGGQGYVGLTRCAPGLRCYTRSTWYSHCAETCPGTDWVC